MSGARATFTLKRGVTLKESQVAAALKSKGLKLETFAREVRPRPEAAYVATVTGLG